MSSNLNNPALFSYISLYDSLHGEALRNYAASKFLVLRLPEAGLGNRLEAAASAIVLAMLSRRALLIDGGSYHFSRLFDAPAIQWDFHRFAAQHPQLFLHQSQSAGTISKDEEDLLSLLCSDSVAEWVGVSQVVSIESGQFFLPLIQSNPHYAPLFERGGPLFSDNLVGFLLRHYFAPVASLQYQIDSILQSATALSTTLIGIHLRDIYHTTPHKLLQIDCANFLGSRSADPPQFFVAADSREWRHAAVARLRGSTFYNTFMNETEDMGDDPQYVAHWPGIESAV